jgi:hypothetical protein
VSDATADTMIGLYDSEGDLVEFYDDIAWDTMVTGLPDPGTYYIWILEWASSEDPGMVEGGEYALRVSRSGAWEPDDPSQWYESFWMEGGSIDYPIAPGSFGAPGPGGTAGAQTWTMATATPIVMDAFYYGCFEGPLYTNPAATPGDDGHLYRIVIQ